MAVFSGGNGSQVIAGTAGNDIIYGQGAGDTNPNTGFISATATVRSLSAPVFGGSTSADSNGIYVLEKDEGRITRVDISSGTTSTFLDLPPGSFGNGGERGLLGLTFHPDYATNGRFFIFVTQRNGDLQVREYANGGGNPPVANENATKTIITIPHSTNSNHNGGALAFGPDGLLYVSTGDGGGGNDPEGNGQNINTLLGKVLRLDVDGDSFPGDSTRNYAIPASNPFVGTAGADEIFDYGLRNPWRISFDSATGDLWIGDVGQGAREEIDVHRAGTPGGLNFGWNVREGDVPGPGTGSGPFTDPIHSYDRNDGQSVTGGYVYRGPDPGLQGAYIFGDFVASKIWALVPVSGGAVQRIDLTPRINPGGESVSLISSFGIDSNGELYVVSFQGTVYRLNISSGAGDGDDTVRAGAGDDQIFGGMGNDRLNGESGNDKISGGLGGDTINGGAGNDMLMGDIGTDVMLGDIGNDILHGGVGADDMRGGAGDDYYFVDSAGDRILESVGEGLDVIYSSINNTMKTGVERLGLIGTGNVSANGLDGQNDLIVGNSGANTLRGLGGDDSLHGQGGADRVSGGNGNDAVGGGAGNDVLWGDAGADRFYFNSALDSTANLDVIADFSAAADTVFLDNAVFSALTPGALLAAQFKNLSLAPIDASDRILYNQTTGALFYDADGAGGAAAIAFAVLNGTPAITAADFVVI